MPIDTPESAQPVAAPTPEASPGVADPALLFPEIAAPQAPAPQPKLYVSADPSAPAVVPQTLADRRYNHLYSPDLAERILDRYISGTSLHKLAQDPGMPSYATLLRWVKDHPEFAPEFEKARLLRAVHFEEKAIQAAESATSPQDTPAERLRYDAYRWAAEVSDGARYGKKVTHSGDPDRPIIFQVTTGVPAPLPPPQEITEAAQEVIEGEFVEVEQPESEVTKNG